VDNTSYSTCGSYLRSRLGQELSPTEKQFCRELFVAAQEAAPDDPAKSVYLQPFEQAVQRGEMSVYHESRQKNSECARAIEAAIHDSCYAEYHCNLDLAAMAVLHDFGFQRVNLVLARQIQQSGRDARYSSANIKWARQFDVPEKAFSHLDSHPILVDGFASRVRELDAALNAGLVAPAPPRPKKPKDRGAI
jgi:hypothetical protein